MVHVVPLDDWIMHDDSTTCVCEPEIEIHGDILVKHNALDGRIDSDGSKWGLFTEETKIDI